jgi:hypothetical protein
MFYDVTYKQLKTKGTKMKDSYYRGKEKFTREQLTFVVQCMLCGAADRIEPEAKEDSPYENGAVESAGMALATFYAQLTGDGIGIYDALHLAGGFLKQFKNKNENINTRKFAETFVKNAFGQDKSAVSTTPSHFDNNRT